MRSWTETEAQQIVSAFASTMDRAPSVGRYDLPGEWGSAGSGLPHEPKQLTTVDGCQYSGQGTVRGIDKRGFRTNGFIPASSGSGQAPISKHTLPRTAIPMLRPRYRPSSLDPIASGFNGGSPPTQPVQKHLLSPRGKTQLQNYNVNYRSSFCEHPGYPVRGHGYGEATTAYGGG